MAKPQEHFPSEKDIRDYRLLKDMLHAQRQEFDLLSKKNNDGQLNPMKIKMVNRVLDPLNKLFEHEPSHRFLDILKEEDFPTNSDVVLIISQYETAIEEFSNKYYTQDKFQTNGYGSYLSRWMTKEYPPEYYKTHKSGEN